MLLTFLVEIQPSRLTFASQRGFLLKNLNSLSSSALPPHIQVCTHVASYNTQMTPCSPRLLYLTVRKWNVKYLPSPWNVTPQIQAVMGSSHIPPRGSLSSLLFSLFPSPPCTGWAFEPDQQLLQLTHECVTDVREKNLDCPWLDRPVWRLLIIHPVIWHGKEVSFFYL